MTTTATPATAEPAPARIRAPQPPRPQSPEPPTHAVLERLARTTEANAKLLAALQNSTETGFKDLRGLVSAVEQQVADLDGLVRAMRDFPGLIPHPLTGEGAITAKGAYLDFTADKLIVGVDDRTGEIRCKVQGYPYVKFGVPVYPEVYEKLGLDPEELKPGKPRPFNRRVRAQLDENGKPKRIVGFVPQPGPGDRAAGNGSSGAQDEEIHY